MLSPILLLFAQAAASTQTPAKDVIVVGRRAEKELSACLARRCPPEEDIEVSLQASVEQFADGRYEDARHTLQNAIQRHRDHAAELPGPLSSLYATLATVAEHEGDIQLARSSARNNVLVLQRYLGAAHKSTLEQELAAGDSMVAFDAPDAAADFYLKVQTRAAASGQSELAAGAAFRRAWLALTNGRDREAERLADEAVAIAGTQDRQTAEWRDILRTTITARRGDEHAMDALAKRVRKSGVKRPRLLFSDPVEDLNPPRFSAETTSQRDSRIRFADIGYWIRPDGRTAGAELLRTSGLGQWAPGILRQIGRRRYVPLDVPSGHPGIYRIDRFTVRATKGVPIGTRIVQRTGDLSVHVVDLTDTNAMSADQGLRAR